MPHEPGSIHEEEQQEMVLSRRLGAFEFMADHLFDLVVIVKIAEDDDSVIRRIELYYAERGMVSSFVFDRSGKKYSADTSKMLKAALGQLMKETKSRTLARHNFLVWYYTPEDRDIIEKQAAAYVGDNRSLRRYFKALTKNARIIETN